MARTDKTEQIARSVGKQLGDEQLVDKLARLMPWELNALLLAVYRTHGERRAFPVVAEAFERAPAFAASRVNARGLHMLETWFHESARTFELVELAPVVPHGLAALTGIDPNNVVVGTRSSEVLADPTAAMALELTRRIRARRASADPESTRADLALATRARVLRMQPLPTGPGTEHYSQHFALFALATAVRSREETVRAIVDHFAVWTSLVSRAREAGWGVELARLEMAGDRALVNDVNARVPVLYADERTQGRAYYRDCLLRVVVRFTGAAGGESFIGDGGVVDWTGRILSDAKERVVTSGFGAELFVKRAAVSADEMR